MNEKNIVSIGTVIDRIKIRGYIDCNEYDGYMENYEYDNILYYLEKYKNLQFKIDKTIDKLESLLPMCIMPNNMLIHATEKAKVIEEALDILKEDK